MQIHVKLGEPLWRSVGVRRLALAWPDASTVGVQDVLGRLAADYPAFSAAYAGSGLRQPHPYRVFVDATPVEPPPVLTEPDMTAGLSAISPPRVALRDGQTLFIMLPAIGG